MTGTEDINGAKVNLDWLEHGLAMDATYIARLTMEGKEREAQDYIRASGYLDRMYAWKAARG